MNDQSLEYRRVVALLLLAWLFFTIRIGGAWFGHHDGNGLWISAAVANYQRYGAFDLRLLQVLNYAPATPDTYAYYVHHPPLITWSVALAAVPLGLNETAARFVAASFSLVSIAGFYVLCRRLIGANRAALAVVLYVLTPMVAYYGRMPNHEAPALAILMLFAAIMANWQRKPKRSRWWVLAALIWLAAWTAWSAVIIAGMFGLVSLLCHRANKIHHPRRAVGTGLDLFLLGLLGVMALAALIAYYQLAWPGTLDDLRHTFFSRTSMTDSYTIHTEFTTADFVIRQGYELFLWLTPGVLLLGFAGTGYLLRHESWQTRTVLTALWLGGLGYVLIFRNAAYSHEFLKIFLAVPCALAGGAVLPVLWRMEEGRRYVRPLLAALLIVSLAMSLGLVISLHVAAARADTWKVIADEIALQTAPEDRILTNADFPAGVSYYAFRSIEQRIPPERVITLFDAETRRMLYVYCFRDESLPDALAQYPSSQDARCQYVRIEQNKRRHSK